MSTPEDTLAPVVPPEGFVLEKRGPFTHRNGPIFVKRGEDGAAERAFFADEKHANGMGIVHGGMIATFIDGSLAHAVGKATGVGGVTIQLSINYLSVAKLGDWVFAEAWVTRHTKDVAFAEARIYTGERDIARATSVFKLMRKREG